MPLQHGVYKRKIFNVTGSENISGRGARKENGKECEPGAGQIRQDLIHCVEGVLFHSKGTRELFQVVGEGMERNVGSLQ